MGTMTSCLLRRLQELAGDEVTQLIGDRCTASDEGVGSCGQLVRVPIE
jgi:hypothetical protein